MKRSPVSPLNKSLYERLKSCLSAAVYDYVPAGKKPPYVVLTDTMASDWPAKTISGALVLATIKIISEYQGDKEAAELADAVIAAIRQPVLAIPDGWQIALSAIDSHTVERFETHREATIVFKFTMIDIKE